MKYGHRPNWYKIVSTKFTVFCKVEKIGFSTIFLPCVATIDQYQYRYRSGSRSVFQQPDPRNRIRISKTGAADPDPEKNIPDPQHWFKGSSTYVENDIKNLLFPICHQNRGSGGLLLFVKSSILRPPKFRYLFNFENYLVYFWTGSSIH